MQVVRPHPAETWRNAEIARRMRNDSGVLVTSLQHDFEESGNVQDIRLVVDTIPTLAWSARPDGSAEFFNQRWLDYTGLSAKQALDSGWQVTIHPDDLPRILETLRESLNSEKPFEVEGRFIGFDS